MTFKFSNNGEGLLNAAIGTGDTSIALQSGGGASMPSLSAGETFEAVIIEGSKYEWITVTAISGDQLTVTRDPRCSSCREAPAARNRSRAPAGRSNRDAPAPPVVLDELRQLPVFGELHA